MGRQNETTENEMTLPEEQATGDCFVVAANTVASYGTSGIGHCQGSRLLSTTLSHLDIPPEELVLVHALVTRSTDGRCHGHAWVEWLGKELVFDYSNGTQHVVPRSLYYKIGEIGKTYRYTQREARRLMVDTGHYGPWAEELEL